MGETTENDVAEMTAPKAAEPIAAPRYKAELLRARSKFDWAGSTRIALCCWSVKRAAISIAQAIMFTPAAINEELVNSIPPKAHINSVKQVIIGLRVPHSCPAPHSRAKALYLYACEHSREEFHIVFAFTLLRGTTS